MVASLVAQNARRRRERRTSSFSSKTTDTRKRFALNIENKPHGASFQQGQAESYGKMAASMMAKYTDLHYQDYETVLIAPGDFMRSNAELCKLLDRRISYEEIGAFIPEFR
jgi:hypothetical protein